MLKIFDYIFITKPVSFLPLWPLFVAGYYLQEKLNPAQGTNGNYMSSNENFIWVGSALTLLLGAIFTLNQVMARKSKHRSKLQLIAPNFLTPKAAFVESTILLAAALTAGFMFSVPVGLLFLGLTLLAGYFYNFEPFRLKDNPPAALMINGVAALLIFSAGVFSNGQMTQELILHSVPYILVILAIYLYTTLPEESEENYAAEEKTTFALKYGLSATIYIGLAFEVISLVMGFVFNDELIFYPAFFSLPFFAWAAISLKKTEMVRAVKYPIFVLVATMCFKWNVMNSNHHLLIVVASLYFVSKAYYRLRFGVNYPTLAIESSKEKE